MRFFFTSCFAALLISFGACKTVERYPDARTNISLKGKGVLVAAQDRVSAQPPVENAYRKTGIKVHKCWDFRAGRCYRTFRHLFEPMFPDLKFEEPKVKHHALEDAMAQAKHMQKIVQALSSSSVGA